MPGMNRKGPEGKGPNTGRGLGKCTTNEEIETQETEVEERPGRGMAHRRGFGGGRGMGRGQGPGQGRGQGRGGRMGKGPGQGRGLGRGRRSNAESEDK